MFDAAGAATASDVAADQVAQDQAENSADGPSAASEIQDDAMLAAAAHEPPRDSREIVFIDSAVRDYERLIEGINPSAQIVVLDNNSDGMAQIAEVLSQFDDVDAVHIVSHGGPGQLRLGNSMFTLASMNGQHAGELSIIAESLSEDADILIYGCDFAAGETGKQAVDQLAELSGADVAASADDTGNTHGGDWDLEHTTGAIEASLAFGNQTQAAYQYLLQRDPSPNRINCGSQPVIAWPSSCVRSTSLAPTFRLRLSMVQPRATMRSDSTRWTVSSTVSRNVL